jgi:hypothetical protein
MRPVGVWTGALIALAISGCGSDNVSDQRAIPIGSTDSTAPGLPSTPTSSVQSTTAPGAATSQLPVPTPTSTSPAPVSPQQSGGAPDATPPPVGGASVPDDAPTAPNPGGASDEPPTATAP